MLALLRSLARNAFFAFLFALPRNDLPPAVPSMSIFSQAEGLPVIRWPFARNRWLLQLFQLFLQHFLKAGRCQVAEILSKVFRMLQINLFATDVRVSFYSGG